MVSFGVKSFLTNFPTSGALSCPENKDFAISILRISKFNNYYLLLAHLYPKPHFHIKATFKNNMTAYPRAHVCLRSLPIFAYTILNASSLINCVDTVSK